MNAILLIVGLIIFDIAYLLGLIYYFVDWKEEFKNGFHPES